MQNRFALRRKKLAIVHSRFLFESAKLKIIIDKRWGNNKEFKALPKCLFRFEIRFQGRFEPKPSSPEDM